jgi:hypothetical protein
MFETGCRTKFRAGAYIHHLTAAGKSALLSGKRYKQCRWSGKIAANRLKASETILLIRWRISVCGSKLPK